MRRRFTLLDLRQALHAAQTSVHVKKASTQLPLHHPFLTFGFPYFRISGSSSCTSSIIRIMAKETQLTLPGIATEVRLRILEYAVQDITIGLRAAQHLAERCWWVAGGIDSPVSENRLFPENSLQVLQVCRQLRSEAYEMVGKATTIESWGPTVDIAQKTGFFSSKRSRNPSFLAHVLPYISKLRTNHIRRSEDAEIDLLNALPGLKEVQFHLSTDIPKPLPIEEILKWGPTECVKKSTWKTISTLRRYEMVKKLLLNKHRKVRVLVQAAYNGTPTRENVPIASLKGVGLLHALCDIVQGTNGFLQVLLYDWDTGRIIKQSGAMHGDDYGPNYEPRDSREWHWVEDKDDHWVWQEILPETL